MAVLWVTLFENALRDAVRIESPDEAYRVWCPHCGYVLSESLLGVARFKCRNCRWEGVLIRTPVTLSQSSHVIRRGRDDAFIGERVRGNGQPR